MPLLFAFTPAILFQGKPADITMGSLPDEAFFADVTRVDIEVGDHISVGDSLFQLRTESGTHLIKSEKKGVIEAINVNVGGMIEEGDPVLSAEIPVTGFGVFSSMFSAFLGTIAFSSLTMMYWIRKTTITEWLLLGAATLLLYWPTFITDAVGVCIVGCVWLLQRKKNLNEEFVHGN